MTPAEIAAKLTQAQVRALRDLAGCDEGDWHTLDVMSINGGPDLIDESGYLPSDLGRAVLDALDGGAE